MTSLLVCLALSIAFCFVFVKAQDKIARFIAKKMIENDEKKKAETEREKLDRLISKTAENIGRGLNEREETREQENPAEEAQEGRGVVGISGTSGGQFSGVLGTGVIGHNGSTGEHHWEIRGSDEQLRRLEANLERMTQALERAGDRTDALSNSIRSNLVRSMAQSPDYSVFLEEMQRRQENISQRLVPGNLHFSMSATMSESKTTKPKPEPKAEPKEPPPKTLYDHLTEDGSE